MGQTASHTDILLRDAVHTLSPNRDERPMGTEVDLLVIHSISLPPGEYGGTWIEDFFLNRLDPLAHPYFQTIQGLKVSSHLLIDRGGKITQFVPLNQRAWHAGISTFKGRTQCNDFSIGIELEGSDNDDFTPVQYQKLTELVQQIMQQFPMITRNRITGHSDIAPGRKTDPGPRFDWKQFFQMLNNPDLYAGRFETTKQTETL
jgi:AmpD protein